jgi:hypothetical protein
MPPGQICGLGRQAPASPAPLAGDLRGCATAGTPQVQQARRRVSSLPSASRYISGTTSRVHELCPAFWPPPASVAVHFRLSGLDLYRLMLAPDSLMLDHVGHQTSPFGVVAADHRELVRPVCGGRAHPAPHRTAGLLPPQAGPPAGRLAKPARLLRPAGSRRRTDWRPAPCGRATGSCSPRPFVRQLSGGEDRPVASQMVGRISCSTRRVRTGRDSGTGAFPPPVDFRLSAGADHGRRRGLLPHWPYFAMFSISMVPSPSSVTYAWRPLGSTEMLVGFFPAGSSAMTRLSAVSITVTVLPRLSAVKR